MKNTLKDISNTQINTRSPELSHEKNNVFKRLTLSPPKKFLTKEFSTSPNRIPTSKKVVNKSIIQITPKRISTPGCLKNYVSKVTQSIDRPIFNATSLTKLETSGNTTRIVFPTSPVKIKFSNDNMTIGGDGSLNRIRARFKNGLMSPERLASTKVTFEADESNIKISPKNLCRNLFETLKEEDTDGLREDIVSITKKNTTMNSNRETTNKVSIVPLKKNVKFNVPPMGSNKEALEAQLLDIKSLLLELLQRQTAIETRLSQMENQDKNA